MRSTVRVATINILRDSARWAERRPLLASGPRRLDADLIALQEVARPLGRSNAHGLAEDLGGFEVAIAPRGGRSRRSEGIAVLSRRPVLGLDTLRLGGGENRTAQFVRVEVKGRPLIFSNVHYLWRPLADTGRVRQVEQVIATLRTDHPDAAWVVCGDFNALPESRAVAAARRSLTSAHHDHHGREPGFTCPAPLVGDNWALDALKALVFRVASNRPDGPWRGTLDYVCVGPWHRRG